MTGARATKRFRRVISTVLAAALGLTGLVATSSTAYAAQAVPREVATVKVTEQIDGEEVPLEGANVSFMLADPEAFEGSYMAWAVTDNEGVAGIAAEADTELLGHEGTLMVGHFDGVEHRWSYWDGKEWDQTERVVLSASGQELSVSLTGESSPDGIGSISGQVSNFNGDPIEHAVVNASKLDGDFAPGVNAYTGAAGDYSMESLSAGTYQIDFVYDEIDPVEAPFGYAPTYYDGADGTVNVDEALHIELSDADELTDISGKVIPYGAVRGSVQKVVGDDVENASGALYVFDAETGDERMSQFDFNGDYEFVLVPGTYKIGYAEGYVANPHLSDEVTFYDTQESLSDASILTVEPGVATSNINFLLDSAAEESVIPATPTVEGEAKLGATLTAVPGDWDPADVAFSYQWMRGGEEIAGATSEEYVITADDVGFHLSVRVVGTKEGFTPGVSTSEATAVVIDETPATVTLTVTNTSGDEVADAFVQLVNMNGNPDFSLSGTTDDAGVLVIENVAEGSYSAHVYPPQGLMPATVELIDVQSGSNRAETVELEALELVLPDEVTLLPEGIDRTGWDGVPSFGGNELVEFAVEGAPNAIEARFTAVGGYDPETITGDLSESEPGVYNGSFHPNQTGDYTITVTLTHADNVSETVEFDVYIDPAGNVVDANGTPVEGATATVFRSETELGEYSAVPDGSVLLSPRNRTNPWVTGVDGSFSWDTVEGWYKVEATKEVNGTTHRATTGALPVPPEQLGLILTLGFHGEMPAPDEAPSIAGEGAVGSQLSAVPGEWPAVEGETARIEVLGYQWTRNGQPIPGETNGTYTLTPADAGARIGVQLQVGRDGFEPFSPYSVTPEVLVPGIPEGDAQGGSDQAADGGQGSDTPAGVSQQDRGLAETGSADRMGAGVTAAAMLLLIGASVYLMGRRTRKA